MAILVLANGFAFDSVYIVAISLIGYSLQIILTMDVQFQLEVEDRNVTLLTQPEPNILVIQYSDRRFAENTFKRWLDSDDN